MDITSPSLDRFSIYAHFGVPEVWRYDGERVVIYKLRGDEYVGIARSIALPRLTNAILTRFVEDGLKMRRKVREWARERSG